jgi:transposase
MLTLLKLLFMMTQKYYIGVDVSKETLDFALAFEGKILMHKQIKNCPKEIKNLFKDWFNTFQFNQEEGLVCMEHTGIYCNRLVDYLEKANWRFCLESALNIKRSIGLQRGKNDKVDAMRIAIYAWKNREFIEYHEIPKTVIQELKRLYTLRKNLIKSRTSIKTTIKETAQFISKKSATLLKNNSLASLKGLEKDIKNIEKMMQDLIQSDKDLSRQYDIVTSVPGVKLVSGIAIIVTTGGFTLFKDPKKYACYAGVVSFENSSGKSVKGKSKVSKMANKEIKSLLHLAARSLTRSKKDLGIFYNRKMAEGKNRMNVITAMGKKIIDRIFACILDDRLYETNYTRKNA